MTASSPFHSDSSGPPDLLASAPATHRVGGRVVKAFAIGRKRLGQIVGGPLLGLIWFYQRLVSPVLHLAGGPSCGCRFYPTCSEYAAGAIRTHGPWKGFFLAIKRLVRCTPFHPGGVDFVPSRSALRPRCDRAVRTIS